MYSTPTVSPFTAWGSFSWMSEGGWIRLQRRVAVILRLLITLPHDHPVSSRYLNTATPSRALAGVERMMRSNLTANIDSKGDN